MKQNYLEDCIRIAEALDEDDSKYRIAAIITDKRGNVLSAGTNSYSKTHPLQAGFAALAGETSRIFRHAEIHALSRIPMGATPYRIYVARVNRTGTVGLAAPCSICQRALKHYGIREVSYTI